MRRPRTPRGRQGRDEGGSRLIEDHHLPWGGVDAPDFAPFNGDPATLPGRVVNPERIIVLAPGEPYRLRRLTERTW